MFKQLSAVAMTALTAFAETDIADTLVSTGCQAIVTSSGATFSILSLEKEDGVYSAPVAADASQTLSFQYCSFLDADNDSFAEIADTDAGDIIVGSKVLTWTGKDIEDANGDLSGVTFTQGSETVCDGDSTYSFKTNLMCNEAITGQGTAQINSVSLSNCEYTATIEHASGCATFDPNLDQYTDWLAENQWAIGIIYIIVGPYIALFGTSSFPYVMASLIAVFVIGIICSVAMAFGWLASTAGAITIPIVALLLGVIAGMVVRRNIWFMVGLLGLIGGYFLGALTFALISGASGWNAVWGYWVISCTVAVIGCVASCYLGKAVVLLSTSFIGSYLFMRSWTLFFPGHYPSEAELMQAGELEVDGIFWVFMGVFAVSFLASSCFQYGRAKVHDDLDEYEKY